MIFKEHFLNVSMAKIISFNKKIFRWKSSPKDLIRNKELLRSFFPKNARIYGVLGALKNER